MSPEEVIEALCIFDEADNHDGVFWRNHPEGFVLVAKCSDTFAWACADGERITNADDIALLRECLSDLQTADPRLGDCYLPELYASRKRGHCPMDLWLDQCNPAVKALFLATPARPETA